MDDYDFYQINLYVFNKLQWLLRLLLLYSPFFPCDMNVSAADFRNYWTEIHETWWSYRYMFLVGLKVFSFVVKSYFEGFKWCGVTIESYGKHIQLIQSSRDFDDVVANIIGVI